MTTSTITAKLYEKSDKKLRQFCGSRFRDLFELCGGHSLAKRPELGEFPSLANAMNQAKIKTDSFPWHGAVWELASETLFAMLRDQWREREVSAFITQIENMANQFDELGIAISDEN